MINEDASKQDGLRCSPAFSLMPRPIENQLEIDRGADSPGLSPSDNPPIETPGETITSNDEARTSTFIGEVVQEIPLTSVLDLTLDPFLDAPRISPFSFITKVDDHQLEDFESDLLKYPFSTSTPPRTPRRRKDGKGHKRAALATITNISHVTSFISSGITSITDASDTSNDTPLADTSVIQRMRSPSLRRKPAYEDLHSASPTRPSPKRRPVSTVWFGSPQGTSFKSVLPLRIVKRNGTSPSSSDSGLMNSESLLKEDELQDVISAVRDAFEHLREAGQDDEGAAARELINRESIWTCDAVSTVDSNKNMMAALEDEEDESEDEEYGNESTVRSTYSPPPPYAFSNTGFYATVEPSSPSAIDMLKLGDSVDKIHPVCSVLASGSTELSYLQGKTPIPSVESCLDDILVSFEHLISTMGPKFQAMHMSGAPIEGRTKVENSTEANQKLPALDLGHYAYAGVSEDCFTQWSDVLQLDNY